MNRRNTKRNVLTVVRGLETRMDYEQQKDIEASEGAETFNLAGEFLAGEGSVKINEDGITLLAEADYRARNTVKWIDEDGTLGGEVYYILNSGSSGNILWLLAPSWTGRGSNINLRSAAPDTYASIIQLSAGSGAVSNIVYISSDSNGTPQTTFNIDLEDVDFWVKGAGANTHMLYLDAGLDVASIGGVAVAGQKLTVYGNTVISSGGLSATDSNVRSSRTAILDDAARSFTPSETAGMMLLGISAAYFALVTYNTATPACVILTGGASTEVTTGALAGTTGSDEKFTISCHTDGKIYLENRTGATRTPTVLLM